MQAGMDIYGNIGTSLERQGNGITNTNNYTHSEIDKYIKMNTIMYCQCFLISNGESYIINYSQRYLMSLVYYENYC